MLLHTLLTHHLLLTLLFGAATTALPIPDGDTIFTVATDTNSPSVPAVPEQLTSEVRLNAASRAWAQAAAAAAVHTPHTHPSAAAARELDGARVAYLSDPGAPPAAQMALVELMRTQEEAHVRDAAAAAAGKGDKERRALERARQRLVGVRYFKAKLCALNPGFSACEGGDLI